MKQYLLYLIALVCWPTAIFGGTYHLKVDMEPQELKDFFYGASILIEYPNGETDFAGETEADIPEGAVLRIYPMFEFEGFALAGWKENGKSVALEIKTSEWGEIYTQYTMPGKDVVLTAVYSNGSDNPPLQDAHKFTISADNYGGAGVGESWGYIRNVLHIKNGKASVMYVIQGNGVSEGDTILIDVQPSGKCILKEWKENDVAKQLQFTNIAQYEGYYEYVMPDYDVDLVAYFEKYTHKFKVSADHYGDAGNDGWGSIGKVRHLKNGRNYTLYQENEMSEGDTIHIYAQSSSPYWKLKEWKENDIVKDVPFTYEPLRDGGIQYEGYYEYLMPAYDVALVAYFGEGLESPGNPGANQIVGGTLVLNDFKPGGLSLVIPYSGFTSIVVIGDMREKDLNVAYNTSAKTFDLTRAYGFHAIPTKAFASGSKALTLEHILLPSCIDSIASAAFDCCSNLKLLTILATTPPILSYNAFPGGVTSRLTVRVPEASLALYKAAEAWKDLKIETISDEVGDLTLMLPADYTDGRYKNMSIELVNATSGETSKYIVTDSQGYTFRTLVSNTRYTASLKTPSGMSVSSISNIFIDGNKTHTFADVRMPQEITLTVKTPDGKDVTSDVEITWMDATGKFICKGAEPVGALPGTILKYSIKLSDELARQYVIPEVRNYTVKGSEKTVYERLQNFATCYVKGLVISTDGFRLQNAQVKMLQTINGKYTSIKEATTDQYGEYDITVFNVPTTITVGANGYAVKSTYKDGFTNNEQIEIIRLEPADAPSLTVNYAIPFSSDLFNMDFTVYNLTKKKEVTQFMNSYPQILVYEDVAEGDELAITVKSKTKAFMPVTVNLTVGSDGQQDITFPLKQLGGIDASFASTLNASVVGILYDSKQQYIQMKAYEEALLSIRELPDGEYTLISMKEDDRYNKIQNLSQYSELGLTEGTDYVKNIVTVVSGTITTVENEVIPTSSFGDVCYTNTDATYFAVNETTAAIDNYVTVRSRIEFNSQYADGVTNPTLVVDIPDGCEFVENSVIMGTSPLPYTYKGRRLSVPLNNAYDLVKFCILPNTDGKYQLSGNAQFSYGGKTITEPTGTAVFQVKTPENMSFSIPQTIVDDVFYANGMASAAAKVKIYVDGDLNVQTIANAKGRWNARCQLDNPANLSSHQVQAVVETPSGALFSSDVKTIKYDQNSVVAESVTMSHYNPEYDKTFEVVFGFNGPSTKDPSYIIYFPKPDITFSVKLNTENEDRVRNMVLSAITMRGDTVMLYPVFDPATKTWVASHTFQPVSSNVDPPVNVCLDFDETISEGSVAVDREMLNQLATLYSEFQDEMRRGMEEVMAINDDYKALLERDDATQEEFDAMRKRLEECLGVDFSAYDTIQIAESELRDLLEGDAWKQEYETIMNDYKELMEHSLYDQLSGVFTISHCTGLTEASLLEKGYQKIMCTDSSYVYLLSTAEEYAIVDFVNDQYIHVDLSTLTPESARQLRMLKSLRRDAGGTDDPIFWYTSVSLLVNNLSEAYDKLCGALASTAAALIKINRATLAELAAIEKMDRQRQLLFLPQKALLSLKAEGLEIVNKFITGPLTAFVKGANKGNVTKTIDKAPFWGKMVGKLFKSGMSLLAMVTDEINALNQMSDAVKLWQSIPNPCEDDQAAATALDARVKNMVGVFGIYHSGTLAVDIAACISAAWALPIFESPEPATKAVLAIFDFCALFNALVINPAMNKKFEYDLNSCQLELSLLECNKDKKKKEKLKKLKSSTPDAKVLIDPSGYVYEGVSSNRLEGVMTTLFYKQEVEDVYGDKHEETVLWDAENYDQQNPLYTDKDGHYQWYVPKGMWQVKYEKDGYQTAFSEWLPVPPPQLDVNQAMIQTAQPEVTMTHCYPTGIEVDFSKYMKTSTLNTDNIFLTHGGKKVSGKVIILNEEKDQKGNKYASKARFVTDENIPVGEKVQFTVSHKVKSYADVMMANDFSQEFTIEHEISGIEADSVVRITYGKEQTVIVTATPAEAAAGKTLQVTSGTAMIATTDREEYVLDKNGQAEVRIKGLVPGSTALLFSIKEYSASAMTYVEVLDPNKNLVAEPKASIASGSEVTKGQQIALTCETPGAVIYYTLDGSCPCDDTPSRQVYNGPIAITDNVTVIKAMAAAKDMGESDVAIFNYHLHGYTSIEDLSSSVNIYPLVTRSNVNVDLDGQKAKSVSVINVGGVCIFNATNVNDRITIDLTSQPAGLYIVVVQMNNGKVVRKIVKK